MLKFSITKPVAEANRATVLDIIEATEGLNNAWMDLTEAQRNLDEVCQVMENIQQSLDLVAQFGKDAIAPLNLDKGLESLICIPEKLITADKAQEGLSDALKKVWETFIDWCKKVIDKIIVTLKNFASWVHKKMFGDHKSKIEKLETRIHNRKSIESFVPQMSIESISDKLNKIPHLYSVDVNLLEFYHYLNQPICDLYDYVEFEQKFLADNVKMFSKGMKLDKLESNFKESMDTLKDIYSGVVQKMSMWLTRFGKHIDTKEYKFPRISRAIGIDLDSIIMPTMSMEHLVKKSGYGTQGWDDRKLDALFVKYKTYHKAAESLKAINNIDSLYNQRINDDIKKIMPNDLSNLSKSQKIFAYWLGALNDACVLTCNIGSIKLAMSSNILSSLDRYEDILEQRGE